MSDTQVAPSAPSTPPPAEGPRDPLGEHFGVKGLIDVGPEAGKLSGSPIKIAPIRDDKGKFTGGKAPQATPPAAPAAMDDFAQERAGAEPVAVAPAEGEEAPPENSDAPPDEPTRLTELPGILEVEGHTFKNMEELTNFIRRQTAAQSATDTKNATLERSMDELRSYLKNTGLIDQIDFSKDPTQPKKEVKKPDYAPIFEKSMIEDPDLLSKLGEDAARSDGAGPYIAAMRVAQRLEALVNKAVDALRQELSTAVQPHQTFLNAIEQTTKTAEFMADRAMATNPTGALLYPDIRDKKNAMEVIKILDKRFPDPVQALDPDNFHIAYLLWREKKSGEPTPKLESVKTGPSNTALSAAAAVGGTSQAPKLGAPPKTKTVEEATKDILRATPVSRGGFRV